MQRVGAVGEDCSDGPASGGAKTGDGASLGRPGGLASGIALIVIGGGAWFMLRRKRFSS